ncbi:MAG: Phosphoesterase [Acetothermia bacterium 64_32]|nr:MAG: Phosphoesterase [Acetothermia bacterium 64_32]
MRKAWSAVILFLALEGLAGPLLYGPWTGAPAPDGVTVSWAALSPVELSYRPLSTDRERTLWYEGTGIAEVRLEGLAGGTWYEYRFTFPSGEASPVGWFFTAPDPGQPVCFAALSDTQRQWEGPNRVELVARAIASDPWPFHFLLHAGDLVESPTQENWGFFFRSLTPALLRAPLLPVLGNHERGSITYFKHFDLPPGEGKLGERWWALHFGDVAVVGLDTNVTRPQDYHAQISWLRENLSGPEPHRFVVFHHPVFSSDALYGPGSPGLELLWHPVFVELGVDVVLSGHAHNYERIQRDGVTYLVIGGGGANPSRLSPARVEGSQVAYDDRLFYVAVLASREGIEVKVVGVAKVAGDKVIPCPEVLDAFRLP